MTTGEAALYLAEFLTTSGFGAKELEHIACHSLKCTFLSWVAKGDYLGVQGRLLMGHHVSRENQSMVAYSRDELTKIMVVIHKMLGDVKNQVFKPDASKAERLFDAVAQDGMEHPDEHSLDESDADLDSVTPAAFHKQDRPPWDELPLKASHPCFFRSCACLG